MKLLPTVLGSLSGFVAGILLAFNYASSESRD